jgi:hypothetical protein
MAAPLAGRHDRVHPPTGHPVGNHPPDSRDLIGIRFPMPGA